MKTASGMMPSLFSTVYTRSTATRSSLPVFSSGQRFSKKRMPSAMTRIWTIPSMTISTALKAGSYHSIRPKRNNTGLTRLSNSQAWTPTQISMRSRIGAPGYFCSPAVDAARTGTNPGGAAPDLSMKTPCGDLPTGTVATTRICSRSTTALRDPQFLAVGRDVHAVRTARHLDGGRDLHVLGVDHRDRAFDPIAQEPVPAIALRPEIVRPLAGLQVAHDRAVLGIDRNQAVFAGQGHEEALVVRQHERAGRRLADLDVPLD